MTSTICRGCGRADCPAPTARAAYDAAKAALEAAQDEDCRRHTLAATHGRTPEEALGDLERHYQERV